MCRITSSNSGCISGSPPLIVMIDVPISASKSSRRFISSSGTGFDTSSYSLQYLQSRLQLRIGIMCTRKGCLVDTSAFPIFNTSRVRDRTNLARRRHFTDAEASTLALDVSIPMKLALFPLNLNYTRPLYSNSPHVSSTRITPTARADDKWSS